MSKGFSLLDRTKNPCVTTESCSSSGNSPNTVSEGTTHCKQRFLPTKRGKEKEVPDGRTESFRAYTVGGHRRTIRSEEVAVQRDSYGVVSETGVLDARRATDKDTRRAHRKDR